MSSSPDNKKPTGNQKCPANSNLSRESIQQLLAAMGSGPTEDTSRIEAEEYDWHKPHHFSRIELEKLGDFTKRAAAAVAEKFGMLYHSPVGVTVASTTQHFAGELLEEVLNGEQENYYAVLSAGQEPACGFVSIPAQTAAIWVAQLLGDSESGKDGSRELSQLEKSLLSDIASVVVEAISSSQSSYDFQPAEAVVQGQLPLELTGTEELCKVTLAFERKQGDKPERMGEAELIMLCGKLECIAGKTRQEGKESSGKDVSKAILEHLQRMNVSVTAQLASTVLTFEQILNLRVNDVVVLEREVDEPIDLVVESRTILRGWPAKSSGKYALVAAGDSVSVSSHPEIPEPS